MRQRAVIAAAIACGPEILICNEPTTALDVTIQAQVINQLNRLKRDQGLSYLFIAHDYSVEKPQWQEAEPGHFAMGTEKELAAWMRV